MTEAKKPAARRPRKKQTLEQYEREVEKGFHAESPDEQAPEEKVEEGAEEALEGAPKLETPEDPAPPPAAAERSLADPPPAPAGTTTPTYTSMNLAVGAVANYDVDTGVGSAPIDRPSTFSPPGTGATVPAPNDAIDYGQGSQMASRPSTVDPLLTSQVSIDPGLKAFG